MLPRTFNRGLRRYDISGVIPVVPIFKMAAIFLNEFAEQNPDEFKIMVLDNGAFHKAAALKIPENIALVFLPPYSPELNPAEKMWASLKRKFSNKLHNTLEDVSVFISEAIKSISPESVISTCSFKYIFSNLIWTI